MGTVHASQSPVQSAPLEYSVPVATASRMCGSELEGIPRLVFRQVIGLHAEAAVPMPKVGKCRTAARHFSILRMAPRLPLSR